MGISIAPVLLFLLVLILLDSYKLVRFPLLIRSLAAGAVSALAAWLLFSGIIQGVIHWPFKVYSRYGAPVLEEGLKAAFVFYLIRKKKIGFMVDGAIHGFAVGAGFACLENLYYLNRMPDNVLLLWIIRGFGTAVMHGGATAIFAMVLTAFSDRPRKKRILPSFLGFGLAVLIHALFNQDLIGHPLYMTLAQLLVLPVLVAVVFSWSEKVLRGWLEMGLDTDVELLEYILSGRIAETKIGLYLQKLQTLFPKTVMLDMLCFLRVHLELAIRAKGLLLMQGAGFRISADSEIGERFRELKFLEKSIGKTGILALSPILHSSSRDIWQLSLLKKS
jgi:RsiW-degrading membrane proteinase PrsW (M82 family)